MTLVILIAVLVMLGSAVLVIILPDLLAATAAASGVSLALSLIFVVLRAPDVAMAEAAVGAGLSGVLFALTLKKIGTAAQNPDRQPPENGTSRR